MNNAVNAVGDVSSVYFQWRFYLSIVIAVIMALASVYLIFFRKDTQTMQVMAVVDDQYCVSSGKSGTNCNIRVIYKYKNKEYKRNISTSNISLKGDNIKLYIDPLQPGNPTSTTPGSMKKMGYVLSIAAVFMVGFSYIIYRATKANKGFANFMLLSSFLGR